ncbi:MAG: MMPL family transporter [Deltaproteobacteria bacterium]|nr:MMPL family transporter [Deltaproteobacteria bacterium]
MDKILKGLARLISRSHAYVLAATGVLTVAAVFMLLRLEIKPDIMDVLPAKNPAIETFTNFIKDFGTTDNLIVVLESKGGKAGDYFETAAALSDRLIETGLVDFVDYNALGADYSAMAARFPLYLDETGLGQLKARLSGDGIARQISENRARLLSPLSSPIDTEVILRDPLNLRQIVTASVARAASGRGAGSQGFYVSKDNSILILFVKPSGASRDIGFLKKFKDAVGTVIDETVKNAADPSDLKISLAGPYAFAMEANSRLLPEAVKNALISAALVLFLFTVVFRKRVVVTLQAALTLFVALAWTLAAAALIFGSLNMVSSVVTAMLMGLGIDYIVHVFSRCEDEVRAGADIDTALVTMFTKTAPGIITGALTTAAAFFCIMTTSFKGLHNLGIIAGIGVLACLTATLLVMPSFMVLMERRLQGRLFSPKARTFGMAGLARLIHARPGVIIAVSVALIAVAAAGLTGLKFDNSPESLGLRDSEAAAADKVVAGSFGARRNPLAIIASGTDKQILMERYSRLNDTMDGWRSRGVIESASSASVFLPLPDHQMKSIAAMAALRGSVTEEGLRRTLKAQMLKNGFIYQPGYDDYVKRVAGAVKITQPVGFETLDGNGGRRLRLFYNQEKVKTAAFVFPKDANWDASALATVQSGVAALGDGFELTGAVIMFANLKKTIIMDSLRASLISSVLIALIIYAQFRNLKISALVLVPLSAGLLLTLGFMGLAGIPLNFINIAAIPLLLGIGVDYGVYIMQDHVEAGSFSDEPPESSVARVGVAVIMCALTTIAGFGSLVTMPFKGLASLGIIISIGVTACLFAAMVLLPAIIHYTRRRGCER